MRSASVTREVGSALYWVEFREDGKPLSTGQYCYHTRWGALRAARRFIDGKLNPYREEIR